MALAHHRKWKQKRAWCGRRPLKSIRLARGSTPPDEVCPKCVRLMREEQEEFRVLAEEIMDAIWRVHGKLWP